MKHVINSLCICAGFTRENARIAVTMFLMDKLSEREEDVICMLDEHPNDGRWFQKEHAEILNPLNLSITKALNIMETGNII